MPTAVDFITGEITIDRADMPVIQVSPEIRELDVNTFRLELKDLEASADGMPWPDTHAHKGETVLSGITYARFFEIIPYYFLTFEDGQYTVNVIGANNNIADVATENQVRLIINNSAGLINLAEAGRIDYTEQYVWVDTEKLTQGIGTQQEPFNTLAAAIDYMENNNIKLMKVLADITIDRNVKNFVVEGVGDPAVDFAGFDVDKSIFRNCELTGIMAGAIHAQGCILDGAGGLNGRFDSCGLRNTNTLAVSGAVTLDRPFSLVAGLSRPTISMNASNIGSTLSIRGHSGGLNIADCNNVSNEVTVEMEQGKLELLASCTNGNISCRGLAQFTDSSAGSTVDTGALLDPFTTNVKLDNNFAISASLWGKP